MELYYLIKLLMQDWMNIKQAFQVTLFDKLTSIVF
jgi:hypothetical protein